MLRALRDHVRAEVVAEGEYAEDAVRSVVDGLVARGIVVVPEIVKLELEIAALQVSVPRVPGGCRVYAGRVPGGGARICEAVVRICGFFPILFTFPPSHPSHCLQSAGEDVPEDKRTFLFLIDMVLHPP